MRYLVIGLAAVLTILLVVGCGGGAAKPDSSSTVTIELNESSFVPNNIEVVAGTTVRFVLNNVGAEEHEFMIGRTVSRAPGYPDTFETDFFHGVKVDVIGDPIMVMGGEAMLTRDGEMVMEEDHGEGMAMDNGMAEEEDHGEGMAMDNGMAEEEDHGEGMAMDNGMAEEEDHGEGMAMDADHGFMISQAAATGGTVVVVEIPADKAGTWEIGCFVDEGTHYEDGMKGTLTVVMP